MPVDKTYHQESVETEEVNTLQNVGNAYHKAEHRDAFALSGDYVASIMRRLSSTVDQETMSFTEGNRRKLRRRSSSIAMYSTTTSYLLALYKTHPTHIIKLMGFLWVNLFWEHWNEHTEKTLKNWEKQNNTVNQGNIKKKKRYSDIL